MCDRDQVIIDLLEVMAMAISSGDWKVDGACDPDYVIERAKYYLREHGWRTDGITGECWIKS